METFSALLVLCAGNSLVIGDFPAQRPVMRSLDVYFDLSLNQRLSKHSWGWWFATPLRPLWRQCNVYSIPEPVGYEYHKLCGIYRIFHVYETCLFRKRFYSRVLRKINLRNVYCSCNFAGNDLGEYISYMNILEKAQPRYINTGKASNCLFSCCQLIRILEWAPW